MSDPCKAHSVETYSTNGNHRSRIKCRRASAPDSGAFSWQGKPDQVTFEENEPFKYERTELMISKASSCRVSCVET